MAHSLMEGAVKVGMDISIASPVGYSQISISLIRQVKKRNYWKHRFDYE